MPVWHGSVDSVPPAEERGTGDATGGDEAIDGEVRESINGGDSTISVIIISRNKRN